MSATSSKILALTTAAAAIVATLPGSAFADPLPYGPDTCIQGYVWRNARDGDTVCVTPAVRDRTAAENANPNANKDPNGANGPQSCKQGFVWREAFDGDTICVTPDERAQTKADNAAAESRYQRNQPGSPGTPQGQSNVVFEITGSGTVYSIDIDPGGRVATENTAVPWKQATTVGSDVSLLQVVAVGKTGNQGCRITVNGKVVKDQPNDPHCVYSMQ
jgi:MmpS family membrane protein